MLILDIHMSQLLDFEGELEALEAEIKTLSLSDNQDAKDIFKRRKILKKKRDSCVEKIYGDLNDWQTCQVARHSSRPQAIDYIGALFTDFIELSGDRLLRRRRGNYRWFGKIQRPAGGCYRSAKRTRHG